jgi:hypothetical protein
MYSHIPHPRIRDRRPPKKVAEHAGPGLNGKIAIGITAVVGTMWCAYVFTILAVIGLPTALAAGGVGPISWIAQTFLQLVLLSVIIVGQNIQGKAADARADGTFQDAEAILHECLQLQAHLQAQDETLTALITAKS